MEKAALIHPSVHKVLACHQNVNSAMAIPVLDQSTAVPACATLWASVASRPTVPAVPPTMSAPRTYAIRARSVASKPTPDHALKVLSARAASAVLRASVLSRPVQPVQQRLSASPEFANRAPAASPMETSARPTLCARRTYATREAPVADVDPEPRVSQAANAYLGSVLVVYVKVMMGARAGAARAVRAIFATHWERAANDRRAMPATLPVIVSTVTAAADIADRQRVIPASPMWVVLATFARAVFAARRLQEILFETCVRLQRMLLQQMSGSIMEHHVTTGRR